MFGREEPKLPHGECWECTEDIDRCKTLPWPKWCMLPNLKLLSGVVRALIVPNRDPFTPSPENIWLRKHHFQSASMAGLGPARLQQIWTALNHQLVQLLDHPLLWWWCKYLQICVGLCVLNVSNSCGRDETAVVLPLAFRSLPSTTPCLQWQHLSLDFSELWPVCRISDSHPSPLRLSILSCPLKHSLHTSLCLYPLSCGPCVLKDKKWRIRQCNQPCVF